MTHRSPFSPRFLALRLALGASCILLGGTARAGTTGYLRFSVKDADTEKPLAGATVTLHDSAKSRPDVPLTTDAQGGVTSPPLEAHAWRVETEADAYQLDTRTITVAEGTTDVEVLLEPQKEKVIKITVERSNNLLGVADSATQGTVGRKELDSKPLLRTGEIVETVPGVIVTQHSGGGKANQYFFRGFNLDHGTDVAFYVDEMPVNMPTHAHGPGYADLNFVIPELVSEINYRKGSYNAEQGDFSSAGTIKLDYFTHIHPSILETSFGNFGERRLLTVGSPHLGSDSLVYALDLYHYDGPWDHPDDYHRANGVLRYTHGNERHGWDATAMAYDGVWNATDQVPDQAISEGMIDRFGSLNPSDGGRSNRYSLSGELHSRDNQGVTQFNAYAIKYRLDLFSDFTYFLFYPQQGDQIEQADDRAVYGGQVSRTVAGKLAGRPMTDEYGAQLRYDDIYKIGLYNTEDRVRFFTVSQDSVKQLSYAPYVENRIKWSNSFRTVAGLRWDFYNFNVNANLAANSGNVSANIASPKLSLIFGPWKKTEYYLNLGQGFHSNDARAVTLKTDPNPEDGPSAYLQPIASDKPLTRSNEAEIGVRTAAVKNLQSTLSLWYLHLDSELVFDPDLGSSVAGDPSQRVGVEFTNYYTPYPALTVDADFAYSWAKFTDNPPGGDFIPGSVEGVIGTGISYTPKTRTYGSLRLRVFGPEPLTQDDTVRSHASELIEAQVGYKLAPNYKIALQVFNLLNGSVNDIEYDYTYRLPGQPATGVSGIVAHPAEPRSFRVGLTYSF
ncbi:MAG: TonB-dependent receptor [Armatimonadetes bacterium]|nr:TonB-dependent receptor [Armatimonadota bacterium]